MQNAPTVVALKDAVQEAAKNAHALSLVRAELADMEQRGFAGHFASGGVPTERKSLLDNFAKVDAAQREVQRLKFMVVETKGRGEDVSKMQETLAAKTVEMHIFEGAPPPPLSGGRSLTRYVFAGGFPFRTSVPAMETQKSSTAAG